MIFYSLFIKIVSESNKNFAYYSIKLTQTVSKNKMIGIKLRQPECMRGFILIIGCFPFCTVWISRHMLYFL